MYLVTLKKPYAMVQRVEESSVRHGIASRKAIKKHSPQQLIQSVRHGSPRHSPGGGRHPRLLPHLPPLAVHHPGTGVRVLREVSSSSPHVKDWKYLFMYFFVLIILHVQSVGGRRSPRGGAASSEGRAVVRQQGQGEAAASTACHTIGSACGTLISN